MNHRLALLTIIASFTLTAAACASDQTVVAAPATTAPGISHPTRPDDVVLRWSVERLAAFVAQLGNLEELAGVGTVSDEQPYVPTKLAIRATPHPERPADLAPTVAPWPDAGIDLASASQCAIVSGDGVATLLAANQLSWFTQGGTTYSLLARPVLPGESGC